MNEERVITSSLLAVLALGTAVPSASAATQTSTTATSSSSNSLADELDRALGLPVGKGAATGGVPGSASSPISTVQRAFQSLNPDLSVILDATGGFSERAPIRLAGDDPDLKGGPQQHAAGFTLQEAEVAFQSIVDPYFRADVFLTIPNLGGIEVEEAFVTTTALPLDLQLKAGVFRSALGRQNGQHLHLQDFTRRPLLNAAYLGADGLRPPGAQLSWLLPLPFFLQLSCEAFSVDRPDDVSTLSTFGGGRRSDLVYAVELKAFSSVTESISIYAGANAAFGRTAGMLAAGSDPSSPLLYEGDRTQLYGGDLYLKYKPPNVASSYFSVAWTTEYFVRRLLDSAETVVDGGAYSQIVVQVDRRWFIGLREDLLGLPSSKVQASIHRTSGSVTFVPSEFTKVRAHVEREFGTGSLLSPTDSTAAYLQLEVAIGAHGAHPF